MKLSNATRMTSIALALLGTLGIGALGTGCAADGEDDLGATLSQHHHATADGGVGASGDGGGSARRAVEACGNGIDDDGNGQIDDGCACVPMDLQRCFAGAPAQAGVGACHWGTQTCAGGSEFGTWGACTGAGEPSTEVCDGIDNDCDGVTDEGCGCEPGATRDCYDGAAGTEGRGVCHGGSQTCAMQPDGTAAWGACQGEVTPSPETCNTLDDDCNGTPDDAPPHSSGSCVVNPCPDGSTPTYVPTATGGGSGVIEGGSPLYRMVCNPGSACPMGQVAVDNSGPFGHLSGSDMTVCAPPPPMCPAGQVLDFQHGSWTCEACDLIVQFGALYGNERVCTSRPTLMCPTGEVPTFVYESLSWECRPTCDNGQYDQHYVAGQLVCVPC